ncbi:MAG: hypothetical protein ACPGNT_07990 [Rhodospirillales bacterium]
MSSWFRAVVAALPFLAACEQGPAVVVNYDRGKIAYDLFFHATVKGPLKAVIHGNPFGGDADAVHARVARRIADSSQGRPMKVTLGDDAPEPQVRMILVLGAAANQSANELCQGEPPSEGPKRLTDDDPLLVRAVFCSKDELLVDVEGMIKGVASVDDKRFMRLIFDIGLKLFQNR